MTKNQDQEKELLFEEVKKLKQRIAELESLESRHEQVEEALRHEKELLEALMNTARDSIYFKDRQFRLMRINRKMMEDLNLEDESQAVGKTDIELFGEEFAQKTRADEMRILATGEPIVDLIEGRQLPDGQVNWTSTSKVPVRNNRGEVVGIIGITREINERKRMEDKLRQTLEDLERSNAELEQFTNIASHDLQEPLRMVSSYLQLLHRRYEDKLDSDAKEFIEYAVDGAIRMQKMINALLIYSRVGTRGSTFEPTDCEMVLSQTLDNLKLTIKDSGAVITQDVLPTVKADTSQLAQLFQNLISNAIKFHGEELPRIHISAKQEGEKWIFSVGDNGIGIEAEAADRIFQMFQRLHSTSEYPGTGIGLAVCKRIVERHGGDIWVESESGKGSTFYFTIPI